MFYRKVKKFCYVVNFFIWIIIKNDWCDIKSVKKVRIFFIWYFWKKWKKKNKGGMVMGCQINPRKILLNIKENDRFTTPPQ
jgi:hypothetical protein